MKNRIAKKKRKKEKMIAQDQIDQKEKRDNPSLSIRPLTLRLEKIEQRLEALKKGAPVLIDTEETAANTELLMIVKKMSKTELAETEERLSNQRHDIQAISKNYFQLARDKKVEAAKLAEEARQAKILEEQTALQELRAIIKERAEKSPKSFKLKRSKSGSEDHLEDEEKDNEFE
ncbi:hypothetical protein [Enterococcus alishanensis]|uniref:Uncharacterized protein n=1 Tax=Enterococcus alishanensis TaxID=1303817 RepID=A0ABS6TDZ5_9ENTE|nr:hypothetical protein [Enterococcus alishanensis]MBV7391107.1 hypothetical protein [Enterococcus alishanensis]